MAIAVSPMVSVPMWDPSHQYYLDEQQQQAFYDHQQATMHNHYASMPTPLSGAPPVQHVRTPALPVASSQVNNNGNGPWTAEMDDILIECHARRMKWDQIAEQFFNNTKTGNACRKRYARVKQERAEPARWNPDRIQKVISAYNRDGMREKMWKRLAEDVGERWQDIERCCYNQGFKQMTRTEPSGHSRRRSRATSHRSQASISSDSANNAAYDEEDPADDSGIGGEVHGTQQLLQIPTTEFAARGSYHDISDYQPEIYYRDYR
ncbi:hypothetical protein OHC33_008039 [Knufia fluminis]|uniref:Myb-like domain-containing protein n=2 Tax=Knufia TaxID=430999 RepID=A0AAN8EHJ6_9EURO|nr:hypothetical protein OHC33_008039 [Knufia fluminis]